MAEPFVYEGLLRVAYPADTYYEPALSLDGNNLALRLLYNLWLTELASPGTPQGDMHGVGDLSVGRRVRITVEILDDKEET